MIFDKKSWGKFGHGFSVYDCAIRDRDNLYFLLVEDTEIQDPIPETRLLFVYADLNIDERFFAKRFTQFNVTSIAYHANSTREILAVDTFGHVYSYDTERDGEEAILDTHWPTQEKRSAGISRVVRVNQQLYAIGSERRIYRRKGINSWPELSAEGPGVPFPHERLTGASVFDFGFEDMSSFGSDDMYAVGGTGDVWHFNGKHWQQIHFPSNELLYTVCCAGDGNVYITGNGGSIWVGRNDRWKRIVEGKFSLSFKDTEWFSGRLYCGNSYGLWFLSNGKLEPLKNEVDSVVATSAGRIDISPDGTLMLTAGPYGASIFDGTNWEVLFNSIQLT